MKVTEIHDSELLSAWGRSGTSRTTGVLHLSDVLTSLEEKLTNKRYDYSDPNAFRGHREAGFIYEHAMERALAERYPSVIRPTEVVSREGAWWMSPDGINPERFAVEEYKYTSKSCRRGLVDEYGMPLPQFRRWFWQVSEYGLALGTNRAIIRPFFSQGDYSTRPYEAQLKEYEVEFTEYEQEETHEMLIRHAREVGML